MTAAPAADLDRRFHAFAIDRLLVWSADAVAAYAAWRFLLEEGRTAAGIAVVLAVVLVGYLVLALVLGRTGSSPGGAVVGVRVVGTGTGAPIGVGAALVRQLVLGLATLPTFGLGTAVLAWTAAMDPSRRRHGWHDRLVGSEVLDVRPVPAEAAVVEEAPRGVVNLTAMRLVPAVPGAAAARHRHPEPPRLRFGDPPVPEPARPPERWRVVFDSGESLAVDGLTLVGRRPEPRTGEAAQHLVALRSDDLSLSKTHAQLQVVPDGGLVVTDRGSRNGSVLLRRGVSRDLVAGRPATLLAGDHVRLGDRIMSVAREE